MAPHLCETSARNFSNSRQAQLSTRPEDARVMTSAPILKHDQSALSTPERLAFFQQRAATIATTIITTHTTGTHKLTAIAIAEHDAQSNLTTHAVHETARATTVREAADSLDIDLPLKIIVPGEWGQHIWLEEQRKLRFQ